MSDQSPAAYLVVFVADRADDGHAEAFRALAREVPTAGFFDDPGGGTERTVGAYLRTEQLTGGGALVEAATALSARLGARLEVQFREEVLGFIDAGRPDPELSRRFVDPRDIPEGF